MNAGVAIVDKRNINEGIAQYTTTTRLHQEYLERGAYVWVVMRRTLLDVGLEWIAALLNLDAAYDCKLWMSRSGDRF